MHIVLEHIRSEMKNTTDVETLVDWVKWLVSDTTLQRTWVKALQVNNMEFKMDERKVLDERNKAIEIIESAVYQLTQLERVLDMPERGYTRNGFDALMRTLKEGVRE